MADRSFQAGQSRRAVEYGARWTLPAVAIGLIVYLALFYAWPLQDLDGVIQGGRRLTRGEFTARVLLLFDDAAAGWFGDPPEFAIADRLPVLGATAALAAACVAAGWLCLAALRIDRLLDPLETGVYAWATGFQVISLVVLLLGLAGQIRHPWTVAVLLAVTILLAVWRWRRRLQRYQRPPADSDTRRIDSPGKRVGGDEPTGRLLPDVWLLWAVPFVAVILLGGMLPPIDFDVREYHLQAPKEFYQLGRVTFLPHNVYANMPLGPHMHSLLAMVLLGDWWHGALVGKTLNALCVPLTGLALFAAGKRFFGPNAGVAAALVFVSVPWMIRVSNLGLVEAPYAMFLFLAVDSVLRYRSSQPREHRFLVLAGFMTGAAISCKYPALIMVCLPLALLIVWTEGRSSLRPVLIYGAVAAVVCGAWFAKNAYFSGNPVYPLLPEIFPSEHWLRESAMRWNAVHGPGTWSLDAAAAAVVHVSVGSPWLSPLVVPLAGCCLLDRRRRSLTVFACGYVAAALTLWWLLTHRIDRFWIPLMPVLCLLAGGGVVWCEARPWRLLLRGVLIVGLLSSLLSVICGPFGPLLGPGGYTRFFVSYATLRASKERVDLWHRKLNRLVPPGHRLLVVADAEVFDLEMPLFYNTVFDESILESAARNRTPEQLHSWLLECNVSHVFVHWGEVARYRSPGNYGMTDFVRREWFRDMVERGVLAAPLPAIDGHVGEVYTVLPRPAV